MEDLELLFLDLEVTDTPRRATRGLCDPRSGLIIIHGQNHLLSNETVIELTIVDETDHLKWTCMNDSGRDEPFRIKIPPSSFAHVCVITVKELRRIGDADGARGEAVPHFLVTSERSSGKIRISRREKISYTSVEMKYQINENQPQLSADWVPGGPDSCVPKAVLLIDSTNTNVEVHDWRITVAEDKADEDKDARERDATRNVGHVFLTSRRDTSQRCQIPANILEIGTRYKVTVEGLQLSEGGLDSFQVFRIVCRSSIILKTSAIQAFHSCVDFSIQIQRSTFSSASLLITTNPESVPLSRKWKIKIQKTINGSQDVNHVAMKELFEEWAIGDHQRFDFPLNFHPGHQYHVSVERMVWRGENHRIDASEHCVDFRAELTLKDISALHRLAKMHTFDYSSLLCHWLYRNRPPQYFQDVEQNHGGIMKVYYKDASGDPASPINLQIKGLFFMASVDTRTGRPSKKSPFGSTRLRMDATHMLKLASNLYFVDYYCMQGKTHFVTLVMTKPGSDADRFCAGRLLPLNVHDPLENPFLFYDQSGELNVSVAPLLKVELLFTEDIDIRKAIDDHTGFVQHDIPTFGKGHSTPEGILKNAQCKHCNLKRNTGLQQF